MQLFNRVFLAALAGGLSIVGSQNAEAAFIQCTPGQAAVVVGGSSTTAIFTCNPGVGSGSGAADDNLAGDGYAIQSVRFRVAGTFFGTGATAGQAFAVLNSATVSPISGTSAVPTVSCTALGIADANGSVSGACSGTSAFQAVSGLPDVLGAFTAQVTGLQGSFGALPPLANASFSYEVVAIRNQVPEPTTMLLLAVGLLGAGVARRRTT